MLDDKEILTRYDRYGILDAVKYVKTESGFGLKESKGYVDRLVNTRANYDPTKGTIAWFKSEQLPPVCIEKTFYNYSDELLVIDETGEVGKAKAVFYKGGMLFTWKHHYKGEIKPTHWAFINLPEPL